MPNLRTLHDASLQGKRVLLRAGFDVKIENGKVMETERIEALVPTMMHILKEAALVILSHQGRPKGKPVEEFSQKPLVPELERLLGVPVQFATSCVGNEAQSKAQQLKPGEVLLLENLRFDAREEANDPDFAAELAKLGDVYVNDAFTNCHRAHASMVALAELLPSYAGLQLSTEIEQLSKVTDHPKRTLTLIISGAKMETKVPVIEHFLSKGDDILLGGCIANTFLSAQGISVASSKFEEAEVEKARAMFETSQKSGNARIHAPTDAVISTAPTAAAQTVDIHSIPANNAIFDLGTQTIKNYAQIIAASETIVWNGPMGLYETEAFSLATLGIAKAMMEATRRGAITIVGGGDTIDAHVRYGLPLDGYTFVSTGGGAMLEFMAGQTLPALVPLLQ